MMRLIGLICLISTNVLAQKIKVFEDESGKKGEYRFSGIYSDTTLPKQGSVDIRWRDNDNNQLKTYRVKGQTQDYLPVGKWVWEEAEWDYEINIGASINPSFNATGKRMKWEGNFVAGKPDGKWGFTLDSVSNTGKSNGNLIKIEIQFKKGVPSGTIVLEDNFNANNLKVRGICDENGIATGNWNYSYKNSNGIQIKEDRLYQKGVLIEVKTPEGILKFEKNRLLTNKEGVRIGNLNFTQDEYGGIVSELYHENLSQYFQKGWKLEVFPFDFERKMPVFKRIEYLLQPNEVEDILISRQLLQKQKNEIEELLSGNISIHRSRSGELDTTISFLQLQLTRLNYIDSVLNRTDLPFFTYKNRYGSDARKWLNGLNELCFAKGEFYDSLVVELPKIHSLTDSIFIFHLFKNCLIKNEETFTKYYKAIEDAHISVEREGELQELENKIVVKYEKQQTFYQNKKGISETIHSSWVVPLLWEYIRTDGYEDALMVGHNVLIQLDSLQSWQSKVDIFDAMPEVLKANYTYLAYNPYTGNNDIPIVNKKRFITTVLTNLWPYLLNEIKVEYSWDRWGVLWNRQFEIFNYLMDFSSKDDAHSKRVNRRVRKEKKPERILKIILHQLSNYEVSSLNN